MTVTLAVNLTPPEGAVRHIIHGALAGLTGTILALSITPLMRRLRSRRITLELLFFIALTGTLGASIYSSVTGLGHIYYEVVIVLLAIYRFGQLVTGRQIDSLKDLSRHIPGLDATVRLKDGDGIRRVPIEEIAAGDTVVVAPGETVPVDGRIESGKAYFEEQPHTGEPLPVVRQPGDDVLAGSRLLDGEIELRSRTTGRSREIDRIQAAVSSGPLTRAEKLAQRVLDIFVPFVLAVSLLTLLIRGWWMGQWDLAIFHALAVTIVACPCGLGIAIPLAARRTLFELELLGIRPNTDDFIDRLSRVTHVAFDKTGTLSLSALTLERLERYPGSPPELESWIAAIQRRSTHPVARPFWEIGEPAALENLHIRPIPARGIEARFTADGIPQVLAIGNGDLLEEPPEANSGADLGRRLYILHHGALVASARLTESPRAGIGQTMRELRDLGLGLEILTGDSRVPDEFRNRVDRVQTSLTSPDKRDHLNRRQAEGARYLYVGDGLNDGEAFQVAHASIGLATGGAFAPKAAHAELRTDRLTPLPSAISLARRTRRRMQRLLAMVLIYNGIGILIAAAGLLHPVAAALLMLLSSAPVIATAR